MNQIVRVFKSFASKKFNPNQKISLSNIIFCCALVSICFSAYTRVSIGYSAAIFMGIMSLAIHLHTKKDTIAAVCVFVFLISLKWLIQSSSPFFLVWSGIYFYGFCFFLISGPVLKTQYEQKLFICAFFLAGLTILDALLINILGYQSWMTNYPDLDVLNGHRTSYFGSFQRAYSFGTNASITSVCLVSIFFAVLSNFKRGFVKIVVLFSILSAVAVSFSATGIGTLIFGFFYLVRISKKLIVFLLALSVMSLSDNLWSSNLDLSYRLSTSYFSFLVSLKLSQLNVILVRFFDDPMEVFFGRKYTDITNLPFGDDFGWMSLLQTYGIIGLGVMACTVGYFISRAEKSNRLPAIVLCIGTFHYGALFSLAGQMLFSLYVVSKGRKNQ